MANENYETDRPSIQNSERWEEIKYWNKYLKEKKKIQDKYPNKPWEVHISSGRGNHKDPYNSEWWEDWQNYKREITDLILKPNGNFTKFLYEIRPERDRIPIDTWLRGSYNTEKYVKMRNRNKG